jgi:hypothetical protein
MEINYVCSLGTLCHTASFMQRNNMKIASYPFDWIFSNHQNIMHCVETGFSIFLDKNYYKYISESECGHYYYDQSLCNSMWRHHNPLTNDEHYQYITRCVNRFQQLLQFKETKLFIMTYVNFDKMYENIMMDIVDFNNKFSNYATNYIMLVIFQIKKKKNSHVFKNIGNIHFLQLHTTSDSAGTYFYDETDNIYLDNIIKQKYNFNLLPV